MLFRSPSCCLMYCILKKYYQYHLMVSDLIAASKQTDLMDSFSPVRLCATLNANFKKSVKERYRLSTRIVMRLQNTNSSLSHTFK